MVDVKLNVIESTWKWEKIHKNYLQIVKYSVL